MYIDKMVKSVQATLLHLNYSPSITCPEGKDSWCRYEAAKAKSEEYHYETSVCAWNDGVSSFQSSCKVPLTPFSQTVLQISG